MLRKSSFLSLPVTLNAQKYNRYGVLPTKNPLVAKIRVIESFLFSDVVSLSVSGYTILLKQSPLITAHHFSFLCKIRTTKRRFPINPMTSNGIPANGRLTMSVKLQSVVDQ